MSKLPEIHWTPAPRWQRERLERWLHEWEIERQLVAPEGPEDDTPDTAYSIDTAPGMPEAETRLPAPGQIRLLQPAQAPSSVRPVYVAVLSRFGAGQYLVAPYGRFAEPAIPGELKTRRDEPSLQVLCVWQAQAMQAEELARAWFAGELEDGEGREALAIHAFIDRGAPIPDGLRNRIGPPLVYPADPRHAYLDEQEPWAGSRLAVPDGPPLPRLARAAERRARYGSVDEEGAPPAGV